MKDTEQTSDSKLPTLSEEDRKRIDESALNYSALGKNYRGELLYDNKAYAGYIAGAEDATFHERTREAEQQQPDTDSDPRHHVIPDEGWEWEKPLTNKELFDENARLRKVIKGLMDEKDVLANQVKSGQPDELSKAQERQELEKLRQTVEMLTSGLPVTNASDVKFMYDQDVRIKQLEASLSKAQADVKTLYDGFSRSVKANAEAQERIAELEKALHILHTKLLVVHKPYKGTIHYEVTKEILSKSKEQQSDEYREYMS